MVNAGYVGRDQAAVRAHIEELRREGIGAPARVPMLFPVLSHNITVENRIEVVGGATSGEVEYVLLFDRGELFVGVGSDHTDRDLERSSIVKSKQICRNVLSPTVWPYEQVKAQWDALELRSWVRRSDGDEEVLYQEAPLRSILSPTEMVDLVRSRVEEREADGLVIYSGTIPILGGEIICGDSFRAELLDPRTGRRLACNYKVVRLDFVAGVEG